MITIEFTEEEFRLTKDILDHRYEQLPAPETMTRPELDEACTLERVVEKFFDVTKAQLIALMEERGAATVGDLFAGEADR